MRGANNSIVAAFWALRELHRTLDVGHNVPQEAPKAFAQAVVDAGHL